MPDQNPIYDFLKSNKLTDLDEKSFVNKYSAPDKAKEIHSFFVENKLTDLDSAGFYDKYLKKKVGGEEFSPTKSQSREYLSEGQELADKGFIKTEKLDPSQLVSQYRSPDISLTPKPKKDYYSSKLEKGLIFDKEGKLFAPSSEALTKAITPAEEIDLKKPTQKDLVEKSREAAVVVEEPEVPIEKQGWLLNMVSALDKGFAKNFISSPIKGLGTVLQGATKKVMGGTGEGFVSDNLIKFGDYLNNAIDELTPQDEEFKNTLWDQAAQALGQVGSLVFTGGITGAAGKGAALVSQAPKGAVATAAKALGSQLSSPTAVSAGLSMGQAEFDRAKEAGATDDQAFEAFYKNALTGSVLETIPVMQFFKRFNNSTGGSVANYIKTKGVAGLTGGIEEMTTEVMQQLYSNKTAKDIYNINQDILDGVGSSGGIGFGVGFLLNAMGANAKILRKQGREQEAAVLENQVKQYEDNLEKPKVTSGNDVSAKDIVTQGVEVGTQKAVRNLDRDLANNVITPEQYQEGMDFAEKAAQVANKIPETVTGESRVKSIELLVERNDINQANQNLLQQKQTTDVAYHAGIDEEIKANEERIKKLDSEVYNIAKKPSKEFGGKKYIVDGEEVSQAEFEALQGKPVGTKKVIKPTQEQQFKDTSEGNTVTFTYKSETEVPEVFKDRISSTGENILPDGSVEKIVRVSVPKSLADYELGKTEAAEVEVTEEIKPTKEEVKIKELGQKQVPEGKGNWRGEFNKETDPFRKSSILRAIADVSSSENELTDIIKAAKSMPEESNIINSAELALKKIKEEVKVKAPTKELSKPKGVEVKIYNAKDLKANPDILKSDKNYLGNTLPNNFDVLYTDMFSLKNNRFEKAKTGDVINIFKKDYVIEAFGENKKNPDKTVVKLIRVDKDGNLLRNKDLSKKEKKEGKAKEFEEEEIEEIEEIEVGQAPEEKVSPLHVTDPKREVLELKKQKQIAKDFYEKFPKISDGVFITSITSDESGHYSNVGIQLKNNKDWKGESAEAIEETKKWAKSNGLDFTGIKKDKKVSILQFRNKIKDIELPSKEVKPAEIKKEVNYDEFFKKSNKQLDDIYEKIKSSKFSTEEKNKFREIEKKLKSEEQEVVMNSPLKDIPKIMSLIEESEGKAEVSNAKEVVDKYSEENVSKLKNKDIIEDFKKAINRSNGSNSFYSEGIKIRETIKEAEKRNIDLIGEYTNSFVGYAGKGKDRLNFTLEAFNIKIPKKTKPSEKVKISEKTQKIELAKDFKEATGKASKKAKENAKKEFVDRNFDNIVEKLKIQIKCPT
jgi:hypothetical protein